MTIDTITAGQQRTYTAVARGQSFTLANNANEYSRITGVVINGVSAPNFNVGPQPERTTVGPCIIGDQFTVFCDIGRLLVEYDNFGDGGGASQSQVDAIQVQLNEVSDSVDGLVTEVDTTTTGIAAVVSTHTTQIGTLGTSITTLTTGLATLTATEIADIAGLQAQIASIDVANPGAIVGLTGGGAVDTTAIFESFVGPAENSGSIVGADGVVSSVPVADAYLVSSTIDVDPQVSMYWDARGGTVLIPGPRIPALTPGTYGTSTRTGGGAPGSMLRLVRRASGINKQAFEQMIGGFCIDGTGVNGNGTFTSNGTTTITATAHGRLVGDIIFFSKSANGTGFPTASLSVGDSSKVANSFVILTVTTNTFTVAGWNLALNGGLGGYDTTAVTVASGNGVWTTNVAGIRIPNCQPSNTNDSDQDFDNRKNYTAGLFRDIDVNNMSGSGLVSEAGSGRLHLHNARFIGNRLYGVDIGSNDSVFSGHWASGSNGQFGIHKGSGTGLYATTGNLWGSPGHRSITCGALQLADTAYFALGFNEFNDWVRADGNDNFNAAGCISSNMFHPHAENYSSDGVGINVLNDGDMRLQANIGVAGYQGLLLGLNAWSRTETVTFDTPGNFGGDQVMVSGKSIHGTAPKYLAWFGVNSSIPAMAQVFDGVCTAPNVKPWQGPFSTITTDATNGVNWTAHPLVVGDRVFFQGSAGGLTAGTVNYYVVSVATNAFQVSATYGGTAITLTSTTGGTCYQLSSMPYLITGSSPVGGVYFDSYTGNCNVWSRNGTSGSGGAGKALIQTSKNDSWEGNPNFQVEIGDRTLGSGVPKFHQMIYGAVEMDYAPSLRSVTTANNRTTVSSGTKNIDAYAPRWVMNINTGAIASATFNLPGGMTASYELTLVINGVVTAAGWTYAAGSSSLNSKSMIPPTSIHGYTVLRFAFSADNNDWMLLSVSAIRGWTALVDGATIATPAFPDQEGKFFVTLGGNRTLSNPTGAVDGQKYVWRITQDATGTRTLAYGTKFKFAGGTPTLSTAANAVDKITGVYDATTNLIYCEINKAYA